MKSEPKALETIGGATDKHIAELVKGFGIAARVQMKAAKKVVDEQNKTALKKAKEMAARVYH